MIERCDSRMRARVRKCAQGFATAVATVLSFAVFAAPLIDEIDVSSVGQYAGVAGGDAARLIYENGRQYLVHIFTNTSASATLTIDSAHTIVPGSVSLLLVGGGGGGGGDCGGGGGGGGVVISNNMTLASGTYTVTVGAGAAQTAHALRGANGGNSTIERGTELIYQALGGGGGSNCNQGSGSYRNAAAGGSGGGSSQGGNIGAAQQPLNVVSPGYGHAGGLGSGYRGGGGGGAGAVGSPASGTEGGNGGDGIACDITGTEVYYGGGGGGGVQNAAAGIGYGGLGGGGDGSREAVDGTEGKRGTDGLGGGGGGGGGDNGNTKGGGGGSGIIVIRYAFTNGPLTPVALLTDAEAAALGGATTENCAWIRRILNDDGSKTIIHCWTNAAAAGTLQFKTLATTVDGSGRVVAIGGGGGGGSTAGGGGGAGGIVTNAFELTTDSYTIAVGAGGAGGAASNVRNLGENGGDSTVTDATLGTVVARAKGGGGGGTRGSSTAHRVGRDGGSGGGSSRGSTAGATIQATAGVPADAALSFGSAGGRNASNTDYGGGGGGAGGAGGNATASAGGAGGRGLSLTASGFSRVYAWGGTGGNATDREQAAAGEDGTGAGGNGGAYGYINSKDTGFGGGAGGSGIVFVSYDLAGSTVDVLDDGSVLYSFTNGVDQLVLPKYALARVFLVGGGGGGAGPGNATTAQGGAGGGGAGGLIDNDHVLLAGGTYAITVGAGGAGGAAGTSNPGYVGSNGQPSLMTSDGGSVTNFCAWGGGGGGIRSNGNPGGSGGGGSRYSNNATAGPKTGGAATQPTSVWGGYGFKGGDSTGAFYQAGAGGGGAGGAGGNVAKAGTGGAGGDGRLSDITGTPHYYAAGGGGGARTGTGGAGGSGIGGDGGGGATTTPIAATAGADGTGSGGGGGRMSGAGGKGGSGVVYVRIFRYMPEKPIARSFAYTGATFTAFAEDTYAEKAYTLTGDYAASAVGAYTFTATPNAGFCWSDGSTDAVEVTWSITPPALVITSFTQEGWQLTEAAAAPAPVLVSTPTVQDGEVTYLYSASESDWSAATADKPTAVGTWYVKPQFDSANFTYNNDNVPVASFTLWDWDADKYTTWAAYHADLTDTRYTGTSTLTDFPVLVRVNATSIPGFYDQCQPDGRDVRFTDAAGNVLPFELNAWDPEGESSWWVKVPEYKANSYVATINWGVTLDEEGGEIEMPENDPTQVWSEYAGVWHFDETIVGDAATAVSADATANGYDAVPTLGTNAGGAGIQAQMVSTNGVFGLGRVNSTASYTGGNRLVAEGSEALALNEVLTFSGWVKVDGISGSNLIVSRKETAAGADGWQIGLWGASSTGSLAIWGSSSSAGGPTVSGTSLAAVGYFYVNIVFNGANRTVIFNDSYYNTYTGQAVASDNAYALAFGGGAGTGSQLSLWGGYDEFRLRPAASSRDWALAEYQQANLTGEEATGLTYGTVVVTPDVTLKNAWLTVPAFGVSVINVGEDPTGFLSSGTALYGEPTSAWCTLGDTVIDDITQAPAGSYKVKVWVPAGAAGTRRWDALEAYEFPLTVLAISPYRNLVGDSGTLTQSGRVLTVNDDDGFDPAVADQSYWQTNTTETAYTTYWTHEADVEKTLRLMEGTVHTLQTTDGVAALCGATRLWRLEDIRIGSTYAADNLNMLLTKNFLPYSPTAKAISSPDGETGAPAESAHLVMRNVEGAAVYSPCYTNGIGTIYFDAVNGWTEGAGEYYNIEVQIATNCVDGYGTPYNELPTDDKVQAIVSTPITEEDAEGNPVTTGWDTVTNHFAYANWQTVELTPLVRDSATYGDDAFHALDATNTLALAMTHGGTLDNFYRVCAKINYDGPVRFRIIRTTAVPEAKFGIDEGGFVLLDNVVVSYPAARVDLSPYFAGNFDATRTGAQTLGWAGAFDVPFPGAGVAVKGRAGTTVSGTQIAALTDPDAALGADQLVVSATMHYRWRYLDQRFDPGADDWRTVSLDPTGDFRATTPLELPAGLPGDVEFWYSAILNAPYYDYVDYTGRKLGVGGYSEAVMFVTNRLASASALESGGTDWFVRLRDGASEYEDVTLQIGLYDADGETVTVTNEYAMAVTGSHVWRGYYATPTDHADALAFRLAAKNAQETWASEWVTTNATYYVENATNAVPVSSTLRECDPDDTDNPVWTKLAVDKATGYLMFQFDDQTKSIAVVHADYQNFNGWSDAAGTVFVGTTNDYTSAKMSGTSAQKRTDIEDFAGWQDMAMTNVNWTVPSSSWLGFGSYAGGRTAYASFKSEKTGLWDVGPGTWVAKNYRDDTTTEGGIALLMDGAGDGFISLTDASSAPRGVERISFNARLGQSIDFSDFSYCDIDGKAALTNYTFIARGAFDTNSHRDYRGNASLSLAAYYRPGVGCYEFRVEQYKGTDAGINRNSHIFSLYRWRKSGSAYKAERLGCYTNGVANTTSIPFPDTKGATGYYLPMYISVSNEVSGATCIIAGVYHSYSGQNAQNTRNGILPGADIPSGTTASECYTKFIFRDTNAKRLTSGTYGVLSANCPGVFLKPVRYAGTVPIAWNAAETIGVNRFYAKDSTTSGYNRIVFAGAVTGSSDQLTDSAEDVDNLWGTGRMQTFKSATDANQYGLRAVANETQTLILSTAPAGKTDAVWTEAARVAVTNFGKVGLTANYTIDLYTPETVALRMTTSEDSDASVVIDSFDVTQFAGDDYQDESDGTTIPNWTSLGDYRAHTNFVFTSGIIKDEAILMSAKRTAAGEICSIRSPIYDGSYGRGLGLGMISFEYKDAQPNARLLVQVATNVTYSDVSTTMQKGLDRWDTGLWTTVTNFTFRGADVGEPASGVKSVYTGLHGVQGALRLILDPTVVTSVANTQNTANFGEITITKVTARDEPVLDAGCWWGWNLRTVGDDGDTEKRMYLNDAKRGLSLALNDARDRNTVASDEAAYRVNQPFVQTPTFTANVVGEISFRARMYGAGANARNATNQWASVQLYGATDGALEDNASWRKLGEPFVVSNTLYTSYSYKTAQKDENYRAFRLAVTGVSGLNETAYMDGGKLVQPENAHYELADTAAVRILLDEIVVSEAIRARVGFRNVGCFASRTDTQTGTVWANINDFNPVLVIDDANPNAAKVVQPLWKEGWGVQCEIFKEQLPDEIDFDAMEPEVYLHWFKGTEPWGYANWSTNAGAHVARLAPAEGTNLVYRSSYAFEDGSSVVEQSATAGQVVQYMLEVRYLQTGATEVSHAFLPQASWRRPDWFAPVDYNTAGPGNFAAFTILDSVAPGWAWINEINIFGEYGKSYSNTETAEQFVEVAAPADADMSGWKLYFLCAEDGGVTIVTNRVGNFGSSASLPRSKSQGLEGGMAFFSLANPFSKATLEANYPADGQGGIVDGSWSRFDATGMRTANAFAADGSLAHEGAFGIALVRPNGIVEHAVACVGTNYWGQYENYAATDSPTGIVASLSKSGVAFIWAGQDNGGAAKSLGVLDAFGEAEDHWSTDGTPTPGRLNAGQVLPGTPPTPNGETLIVYASVDTALGHIVQTVGEADRSNLTQILYIRRGDTTNITYTVDRWYELGSVTTNGAALAGLPAGTRVTEEGDDKGKLVYVVPVGADISNNFTVVGTAKVADRLRTGFGLGPENAYTPAVMDWLLTGRDARGNAWADPDATEPLLADFLPLNNPNAAGTLSLTEMYWLDIDPTLAWTADPTKNARALKGGMSAPPTTVVKGVDQNGDEVDYGADNFAMTNVRFGVKMMITNRNDSTAVAPYVLRGLEPGSTSWDYTGNWTSATFQVTGFLANGRRDFARDDDWLPLRWFVFVPTSFDANFETQIEVKDPYSRSSPGWTYGWKAWVDQYGYAPVFFKWALRQRGSLIGTETLNPTNYYENAD